MKRFRFITHSLGLFAGWLLLSGASLDTHRAVQQGNAALAAGDAAGAAKVYEQALEAAPDQPTLIYNLGTASLAASDPVRAEQLLADARERALQLGPDADPKLAGHAAFNLGNAFMAAAEGAGAEGGQTDPKAKQAALKSAVDAYRNAIAADPTDPDARRNLQLAASALKSQQQQQDGESEDGDPQEGEQGKEGEQGQESEANQDGKPGESQKSDDSGDAEAPQQADAGEKPDDKRPDDGQSGAEQQAKQDATQQPADPGDAEQETQQTVDAAQQMDPRDVERLLGSLSRGEAATMREAMRRAMGPAVAVERDW